MPYVDLLQQLIRIMAVILCWILWVCMQQLQWSSKIARCPHKLLLACLFLILVCGQVTFLAFSLSSDLANTWSFFFFLLTATFVESQYVGQLFLSSGLCYFAWRSFASCLLTWAACCCSPCHVREAEQMGSLALLVLHGCVFGKCKQMVRTAL